MSKLARARAEEKFAAIQKRSEQAANEKDIARLQELEHTASLRALRLAKAAVDAEQEAAKNR